MLTARLLSLSGIRWFEGRVDVLVVLIANSIPAFGVDVYDMTYGVTGHRYEMEDQHTNNSINTSSTVLDFNFSVS